MPPPTSFLYFTSARSGSMPVVSQSIMKPMVPVGASTVTCELRYPNFSPWARAASQQSLEASMSSGNCARDEDAVDDVDARLEPIVLAEARCIRITSRNGSRLMYQPGQAAPGITASLVIGCWSLA